MMKIIALAVMMAVTQATQCGGTSTCKSECAPTTFLKEYTVCDGPPACGMPNTVCALCYTGPEGTDQISGCQVSSATTNVVCVASCSECPL